MLIESDISKKAQEYFEKVYDVNKDKMDPVILKESLTYKYNHPERLLLEKSGRLDHNKMREIWFEEPVKDKYRPVVFIKKCIQWNLSRKEAQGFLDNIVDKVIETYGDAPKSVTMKDMYSYICSNLGLDNKLEKKPETVRAGTASGFREYKEF